MVKIKYGDITQSNDEVVVNAANTTLLGGGGVDSAIHRAAGDELMICCMELPSIKGIRIRNFQIVKTPSFKMPCGQIWHVVGPVFNGSNYDQLKKTYEMIMQDGELSGIKSISIPAISTGAYGFPSAESLEIAKAICSRYNIYTTLYLYSSSSV